MCCIEPSEAMRLVLSEIARKAGWEIEACGNLEAAEAVFADKDSRLDLVVTSATLPSGGYAEVVRSLRSRIETETLPIVLFISSTAAGQAEKALENGITEVFLRSNLDTFEIYLESFFEDDTITLSGRRVLILEDEKAVGEYLRAVLTELHLRVDLFQSSDAALGAALVTAYDLVVTDLVLAQNQSGVNFIRLLRQSSGKSAAAPVIAMSGFVDDTRRIEALRAGAHAFLAKPVITSELYFLTRQLLQRLSLGNYLQAPGVALDASLTKNLTDRERLICGLAVAGHRDKQIARQLGISYWTVRSHLGRIFNKCGVTNRIELATKLRMETESGGSLIPHAQAIAAAQDAVLDWLSLAAHVMNEIRQGVLVTDKQGTILLVNLGFTQITGYTSEEVLGKSPRLLKSGHHPPIFYRDMFAQLEAKGTWSGEIWNRGKAGNLFVEWLDIRRLPPGMPMGAHYVAVVGDITRQHKEIEHLRHSALHDPLTGLANRALLADRAKQEMLRARRSGKRLGVAFIDLDGFKPINDTLGHEIGDKVLRDVAKRLAGTLRAHDTLARHGGDEFIVLLPDIEDRQSVQQLGQKLLDVFQTPVPVHDGMDYPLYASIGLSLFPDDGDHFEELVVRADKAMYRVKQAGGAGAWHFDPACDCVEAA
jgi:diguanylate cyclase (GGDEF)-like protein/PAS domain S-box-containing protein